MKQVTYFFLTLALMISCSKADKPIDIPEENLSIELTSNKDLIINHEKIILSAEVDGDIREANFYLDGLLIGSKITKPYNIEFIPIDVDAGQHKIKCIVENTKGSYFSDSLELNCELRIGDLFKGGIIFSLSYMGLHGLIAAPADLHMDGADRFLWADEVIIGRDENDGVRNTKLMIENSSLQSQVGHILSSYSLNDYSDWYLPSINELKALKQQKNIVGGFTTETGWEGLYWSSSELSEVNAEALNFNSLMGNYYEKNSRYLKVRLIRSF